MPEKPRKLEPYTSTEYGLFVEANLNKEIMKKTDPEKVEPRVISVFVGGDRRRLLFCDDWDPTV